MKLMKYVWYVPALYVAYMFGNKIVEGFSHSQEFIDIISVIPFLRPVAYSLTPCVGLLDFSVGLALLFTPFVTKNSKLHEYVFMWAMVWPFVPASLRYFGGVGEFEIVEVLSISISALVAFLLWKRFSIMRRNER